MDDLVKQTTSPISGDRLYLNYNVSMMVRNILEMLGT